MSTDDGDNTYWVECATCLTRYALPHHLDEPDTGEPRLFLLDWRTRDDGIGSSGRWIGYLTAASTGDASASWVLEEYDEFEYIGTGPSVPSLRLDRCVDAYAWRVTQRAHWLAGRKVSSTCELEDEPDRWLLLQKSTIDTSTWVSTHADSTQLRQYLAADEYPEDWEPDLLIDLDAGRSFSPITTTKVDWAPSDTPT